MESLASPTSSAALQPRLTLRIALKRSRSLAKLLLIAAPPLLMGFLIFRDGVDVPFWDQWDGTATLFEKAEAGKLGFADFFAQHNEHRILFPRLIFFALGRLTHWNVRAELFVIWFLALVCLFNIWQIARRSGWRGSTFWLLFSSGVLLFSPLSFENFLWGFQIGFLLPLACVTACIWVATYVRHPLNFVFAIVLCTICTFSIASGLTSWLLITPLLLLAQTRSTSSKKWWAIWICAFLFEVCAYFYGYIKPTYHPAVWWPLSHPVPAGQYVLIFLGNPFTYGTHLPPLPLGVVMGGLLVLILLVCAIYLWIRRHERNLLADGLPWLILAMVAVSAAVLTMIGRSGFGTGQARSHRYVAFSVMLPIGLLALTSVVRSHWIRSFSARGQLMTKTVSVLLLSPFILLACPSFLSDLPVSQLTRQTRLYGKALVSFVNVVPEPEEMARRVHPSIIRVKTAANLLNRIGYLRPPLLQSNLVRNVADPASNGSALFGDLKVHGEKSGYIELAGQAFLPEKPGPADAVLITYDNAEGEPVICAVASMEGPRPDRLLPSRWRRFLPIDRLPEGQRCLLKAWSYDAEACRAYRLQGSATVAR
jgi:hypothetical protein